MSDEKSDQQTSDEAGHELDEMVGFEPPVLSSADLETTIKRVLAQWVDERPWEVAPAMKYARKLKDAHSGSKSAMTGMGNHILGTMPEFVSERMAQLLHDPNWLNNNKKAVGILFRQFEVGRVAYWEGRGYGGSSGLLTLCEGDRD